jgi:signal transduction histidine kinase/ActR/RegA family two-component response regulator
MRIPAKYALTYGFSGLIIVLAFLIILSSTLSSKAVLKKHARTIMENIASYTIDKSQNHLEPARKAARLTLGLSKQDIVSSKDINSMVAYFYEQLYLYPQFSGIYFGSTEGRFVMASRYNLLEQGGYFTKLIKINEGKRTIEKVFKSANGHLIRHEFDPNDNYDPRTRPWFKKAKEKNDLIWTKPYVFFTSKKPGITTANPVFDGLGNFQGVIGVDIEIDKLSTFISKLNVSANGKAFILSQKGDIIAHSNTDKVKHLDDKGHPRLTTILELDDPIAREAYLSLKLPPKSIILNKPIFTSFTQDGEKYMAMFAPFFDKQWPWLIGIYMPENDYLGSIKQNGLLNIAIALLAVGLALIAGLVVARKLNTARENAEVADLAKSQFLARMSHEIRTPMNAILGAGELLAETKLDDEQKQYLTIYKSSGEHLRELLSSILDISRIEAGHYKLDSTPFDLHDVVKQICQVFSLTAQNSGIELNWNITDDTPQHLIGDPTVLKQIIVNLLGNALKFTHEGSVSLAVKRLKPKTENDKPDTITLQFEVTDTGIGITKEQQAMIFERFTQADGSISRKYGGTGLGLSISHHMARLMDGEITVSSEPNHGSTFSLIARFVVDDTISTDATPPKDTRSIQTSGSTKRILLVEDDESNRLLFSLLLKGIPHILEEAVNGEEALLKHSAQPYDLIFMDIEMPGINGYQATEAIRAHELKEGLSPTPIIAVTAHAIKEVEEQCEAIGCTGYLSKPLTRESLRQIVADFLVSAD